MALSLLLWRPEICDELKVTHVHKGLSTEVRLGFGSFDFLILVLYQAHPLSFLIIGSFVIVCSTTDQYIINENCTFHQLFLCSFN